MMARAVTAAIARARQRSETLENTGSSGDARDQTRDPVCEATSNAAIRAPDAAAPIVAERQQIW